MNSSLVDLSIVENPTNFLEDHRIMSAQRRTQKPQRNQSRTNILEDESLKKRPPQHPYLQRQESAMYPHDQGTSLRLVHKTREGNSGNVTRHFTNQNITKPRRLKDI